MLCVSFIIYEPFQNTQGCPKTKYNKIERDYI